MSIHVTLTHNKELINDLLSTLFETSYSDFWLSYNAKYNKKMKGTYYDLIEKYDAILLEDAEDPEEKWTLSRDKMRRGFELLDHHDWEAFGRIAKNDGAWDSEDADQWLQYSLFETIIYS